MVTTIPTSHNPTFIRVEGAQTDLDAAMHGAILEFATEAGLPDESDNDIVNAARQPVSLAAAYRDLCHELGVPVPWFVRLALGIDGTD
jgi:hypothetical protein